MNIMEDFITRYNLENGGTYRFWMVKRHTYKIIFIFLLFSCENNENRLPFTSIMDDIAYFHYGFHGEVEDLFTDTVSLDSMYMDSLLDNYNTFKEFQLGLNEKELENKCIIFERSDRVERYLKKGIRSGEIESQYDSFSGVLHAYLGDMIKKQKVEKYTTCQFDKVVDKYINIKMSPFYMAGDRGLLATINGDKCHLYYLKKRAGFWGFYFVFEL